MTQFLINLDTPDLAAATRFYTQALGLTVGRQFEGVIELVGGNAPLYLLQKEAGSNALPEHSDIRHYDRHWTPVHLDVVVDDINRALGQWLAAGGTLEKDITTHNWGRIAFCADPFGHGFCLIQFLGRGYDEIALPTKSSSGVVAPPEI